MFLMLAFLSMMARIWSTVKFTLKEERKEKHAVYKKRQALFFLARPTDNADTWHCQVYSC